MKFSNVFVLNTGRCGSTTFSKAAKHIINYTAGHETRRKILGPARLNYPENHIEVDNRLSWYLGRLERRFGNDGIFYVWLQRNPKDTRESFKKQWGTGVLAAWSSWVCNSPSAEPDLVVDDYIYTVSANIEVFLKNKRNSMIFRLENYAMDWPVFWNRIGAEGDYNRALAEWKIRYNAG